MGERGARILRQSRPVLVIGSWLLALPAVGGVATLAAGRATKQTRRVGLLKAVGATPGLIAAVLLGEYLTLALIADVLGLTIARLAAPGLANPTTSLLSTAAGPTGDTIAVTTFLALAVAVLTTLGPTRRALRTETVTALAGTARRPTHRAWLNRLSALLPTSLLLALRLIARRPGRAVLHAWSIAVAVIGATALLVARVQPHYDYGLGSSDLGNVQIEQGHRVLLAGTVALAVLAAVNILTITWTTTLEARPVMAIARTLGATPGQITAGLSAAQLLPTLPGVVVGLPVGMFLVLSVSPPNVAVPPRGRCSSPRSPLRWRRRRSPPCPRALRPAGPSHGPSAPRRRERRRRAQTRSSEPGRSVSADSRSDARHPLSEADGVWAAAGTASSGGGRLAAGAVAGDGRPAGAGVGAEAAAAIAGVVDVEAGAAVRLAAAHGHLRVSADRVRESRGAAAAEPSDGFLSVAGEVQVRLALPVVLADVDRGREAFQEQVDGGGRSGVRDGRDRLAQGPEETFEFVGVRFGDVVLAEELSPQLAGLVTVDQFDGEPGQIPDVGNVTHLTTYLLRSHSRRHGHEHPLHYDVRRRCRAHRPGRSGLCEDDRRHRSGPGTAAAHLDCA